jgi:uncharacterized protein
MRILRADDYRVMPWKNGKGATREIAVDPEGATLDSFMWRISLAQVDSPGPFSAFPGCDRTLCLVRGGPLHLSIEKSAPVRLARDSAPFHFAADVAADVTALDAPVVDFNVMVRRGRYRAIVESRTGSVTLPASRDTRAVFVREGTGRAEDANILRAGDTLLVDGKQTKIAAGDDAVFYIVTLVGASGDATS